MSLRIQDLLLREQLYIETTFDVFFLTLNRLLLQHSSETCQAVV